MPTQLLRGFAILFSVSLFVSGSSFGGPATTQSALDATMPFDPARAVPLASEGAWLVWMQQTLDAASIRFEAQTFHFQYFVQQIDKGTPPVQVYETAHTGWGRDAAMVLPDGTMLLFDRNFHWATPGQPVRDGDPELHFNGDDRFALFPDGIIWESNPGPFVSTFLVTDAHQFASVWWVPIRDTHFDVKAKVLMEESVGGDISHEPRLKYVRHGDDIAWLDALRMSKFLKKDLHRPPALYIYNISKGAVRTITLSGDVFGQGTRLSAFDGAVAFDGIHIIDVATGQTKTIPYVDASVGLRDGIAYGIRRTGESYELIATPLNDPGKVRSLSVLTPKQTLSARMFPDGSIRLWDGQAWANVPLQK